VGKRNSKGDEQELRLLGTEKQTLHLPPVCREEMGVPRGAVDWAWVNSYDRFGEPDMPTGLEDVPVGSELDDLLRYGAYLFFDSHGAIISVNTLAVDDTGHYLRFGSRGDVPPRVVHALRQHGRFAKTHFEFLCSRGCTEYCWLKGNEQVFDWHAPRYGAFVCCLEATGESFLFAVYSD